MTNKNILILITLIISQICLANESLPLAYYHINDWQVESSLGQTTIGDIGQNIYGDLVVATGQGIKVFNGAYFDEKYQYNSNIGRNGITKLEIGHDGIVWGVNQVGVFKFSEDKVHIFKLPIFHNIYNSLALTSNNVPWVISHSGLFKIKNGKLKKISFSTKATALAQSHDLDAMVVGVKGGVLKVDLNGSILEQVYFEDSDTVVLSLFESSNNTIWVSTSKGIFLIKDTIKPFLLLDNSNGIRKFYEDSESNIWILTDTGIFVYEDFTLKTINIEDNKKFRVRGIVEDQYGNIWFGTWGRGLFRLKRTEFNVVTTQLNPTAYIQLSNGTELIGGFTGAILKDKDIYIPIVHSGLQSIIVNDVEEGLDGNFWVLYRNNLIRYDENGKNPIVISTLKTYNLWFLIKDTNDNLWVGTDYGLFVKDLRADSSFKEFKLKNNEKILTMLQLKEEGLLFLTNKGAYIYHEGHLKKAFYSQKIESNNLMIAYDKKLDTAWYYVRKEHQLLKISKNKIQEYKLDKLLKDFVFYNLEIDQNGDLIFLGESGVLRIRQKWFDQYELNENTVKHLFYEVLAIPDNNGSECNSGHNSLIKNLTGILYLTCRDTLLALKTVYSDVEIQPSKPIVTLVGENHKGKKIFFSGSDLEFSPETSSYDFSFVSNSLDEIFPLRYRYMLHGLEEHWNDDNKKNSVTYVKLKPGDYKFEVQVKNTSHDWETSSKGQIDFIVKKFYYQKTSFLILMSLIILIFAIIIFTLYDYIRHSRYISKEKILTRLVEEKTKNLQEVQQRELNHEKVSRDILAKEIKNNTEKLTHQMEVILKQEKQIRETQKMEVVGQLTSGIAHDFNNMLSIIFMGSDVIKKNLTIQEKDQNINQKENLKWLDKVLKTSENCKEVIGQLLHFSRNNTDSKTILSINETLENIVSLIKVTIPNTLNFSMDLMQKQGLINVDIAQFNQIILNVIINARDACNDYGEIKVVTSIMSIDKKLNCASCKQLIKGKFIEVQIADNGKGIPKEIQPSIFKPFFTVKKNNLGNGIGLNVVDSNIHNMNGHIIVESKVGVGTIFRVLIPLTSKRLFPKEVIKLPIIKQQRDKTINVLLVEDSASLVDLICLILKDANIKVDVAIDGILGSELFYKNPEKYDLIISDNSMPRLKGLDMAKKILQSHANTKLVLLTGDVTKDVVQEAKTIGIVEVLHKPIRADDLVELVFKYVE